MIGGKKMRTTLTYWKSIPVTDSADQAQGPIYHLQHVLCYSPDSRFPATDPPPLSISYIRERCSHRWPCTRLSLLGGAIKALAAAVADISPDVLEQDPMLGLLMGLNWRTDTLWWKLNRSQRWHRALRLFIVL